MYMMGLYELEFLFTSFNKKLQSRNMYRKYVKCIGGVLCSNLVDLDRGSTPVYVKPVKLVFAAFRLIRQH